jgi:hypothetical protein
MLGLLSCGLAMIAVGASAQQARRGAQQAEAELPPVAASEVRLVYEREVYTYRPGGRRDPFRPLSAGDEMGPRFDKLTLQAIIHGEERRSSIAMLGDASGRIYRLREGDVLGNARVVQIGPNRVVMAVETFGTVRQETLELPRRGGAQR